MWREDGLCCIQAELGEDALCHVCRTFPRLRHDYGDFVELGLELSCPEAARLILTTPPAPALCAREPGGETPDYDGADMAVLKRTRAAALGILRDFPARDALTLLLFHGALAQQELDGAEPQALDPAAALETAEIMAQNGDNSAFFRFFLGLELLTPRWEALLRAPAMLHLPAEASALARYLVERYWLQAISDYDLMGRAKFVVISCLLVGSLPGDFRENAQLYSREIENDADNVDALLDATAQNPAFTDARLLGMLAERGNSNGHG